MKPFDKKLKLETFLDENSVFKSNSFISLNPYYGCTLACDYCYRQSQSDIMDVFAKPKRHISDEELVDKLIQSDLLKSNFPISLHDSSTDPFLPQVQKSTFNIIDLVRGKGIDVPIVIISKFPFGEKIASKLSEKEGVLLMYGISMIGKPIEPYNFARKQKTLEYIKEKGIDAVIHYRPVIPGVNDSSETIHKVLDIGSTYAKSVVTGGIQFTEQIKNNLDKLIKIDLSTNEHKQMSKTFKKNIEEISQEYSIPIFFHNSCAVSHAFNLEKNYQDDINCQTCEERCRK